MLDFISCLRAIWLYSVNYAQLWLVSLSGSVSVSTVSPPQVFVSGSCDKTARLWDTRMKNAPQTFHGHDGDVNAVCFLPKNSSYFGTASDDGSCQLFDTRTGHSLQIYNHREAAKVPAIAFSVSGRLMFSSYDNGDCYIWDTLTAQVTFCDCILFV
jgi:guanine nucleotide-binding protein G(I)/G(S)/G(T) subunit beta-1